MRSKALIGSVSCAIIFFSLALYLAPSYIPTVAPVRATTRTISLVASYTTYPYWNNSSPAPTITVTKGDTVNIMLSSDGSQHKLLVDFDGDGPSTNGCTTVDQCSSLFMSTTSISFVATTAGTFSYYCTLHPTYMVGQFVVQPAGPDFGITANPSSASIVQGSNANSTINVSSINNFAGTINLSASLSTPGPMTTFSTNTVMISSGMQATSKLTIAIPQSTSPGSYTITVTGTNGSASGTHTASISVSVVSPSSPNFTINPSPASLTVAQDSSGTISITLTSLNSFSGTIALSATVSPSGPQASLNPSSVTLTSSGSASSTLTVSTAASSSGYYSTPVAVSKGNYTVSVTASSGALSHSTPVSLTVGSTSSTPPGTPSLPLLPIAGGVIAVIAVIGTALFLRSRKS